MNRLILLTLLFVLALPVLAQDEPPPLICESFPDASDDVRTGYYMGEGSGYVATGQWRLAIDSYRCIIEQIDPAYVGAYVSRAVAYSGLRDYEAAVADYDRAIELEPGFVAAWNNRGVVRAARSEYEEALADFNEVLRLDPGYIPAYNNRAVIHAVRGDYDAAIADLMQAINLSGIDDVLAELNDPNRAPDAPQPQFNPDHAQSYALLGIIYSAQALDNYQAYLQLRGSQADQRVQSAAGALESRFTFDLRLEDGTWLLTADFTSSGEEDVP